MRWKPKPIRFSLRTQLILCYMVISAIVLLAISYFCYQYTTYLVKQSNENSILQQLSQTDYNFNKISKDVTNLANMLLMDDGVQQFLLGSYDDHGDLDCIEGRNAIIRTMDNYLYNYNYISSIYLISANGDEIGSNGQYSNNSWGAENKNSFVSSELYRQAIARFPQWVYYGGRRLSYFSPQMRARDANPFQISFAKGVRPITQLNLDAVLVLNVTESYISSLYTLSGIKQYGQICIVDDAGRIISSGSADEIGAQSPFWDSIKSGTDSGGFTTSINGSTVQVIYCRMKNTGWYLVDEVSLKNLKNAAAIGQIAAVSICLTGILIVFTISYIWVRKITRPINLLSRKMGDVSRGHPGVTLDVEVQNEIGALIRSFNEMSVNTAQLIRTNNQIQEEKTHLEVEVLQAQINPHFIYNTLNMIKWMAKMVGAKNIEECIVALGDLLGPAFYERSPIWTLAEERKYLENYLKITNWRFGNLITLNISFPVNLQVYVPKFVLQPIVENSVKYGLSGSAPLAITVQVREEQDGLKLEVSDDGKGIEPKRLEQIRRRLQEGGHMTENPDGSVGLYNVNRRIKLNYGDRYGIDIASVTGQMTCTIIRLPRIQNTAAPADAALPPQ